MTRSTRVVRWGARLAVRMRPGPAAAVAFAGVAIFAALGEIYGEDPDSLLHLDAEWVPPALYSAALLLAASAFLMLAHAIAPSSSWWPLLALFLAWMTFDEATEMHERLEKWIDVDWQLLYVPVAALGGVAWLGVLRDLLRDRIPALLLVGGAATWLVAQVLEDAQWGEGDRLLHPETIVFEETLEMTGSLMFALVGLLVARSRLGVASRTMSGRRAATGPETSDD